MKRFIFAVQETVNKIMKDNLTAYAAQSCFYIVLSLVPALILLLEVISRVHLPLSLVQDYIVPIIPDQLSGLFISILDDLSKETSNTITGITILTIVWSAGKGFMAIIDGLDVIYNTNTKRNWIIVRFLSIAYTLLLIAAFVIALVLVVFGDTLFELLDRFIPEIALIFNAIIKNRMIFLGCFMVVIFLSMYKIIPNRKSSILNELPGAILSTVGWYLFSYFFSLYVNYSPNFSYMYGSLTSLVISLMMLYFCMLILFLGAELNICIQSGIIPLRIRRKRTYYLENNSNKNEK